MTIQHGYVARKQMLAGVEKLARTVGLTLGPRGRNVALEKAFGPPLVTKDGVSVAKEIELSDPFENMGARLVREVASQTSDDAGDGTTTATVLAGHMYTHGMRLVEAGHDPLTLKKGMDLALAHLVACIKAGATPVQSQEDIENVAALSANNDRDIGRIVAEAIALVGTDGIVTIEEGKGIETTIEATDGMTFDKGWISPHFQLDGEAQNSVLHDPYIFVTDIPMLALRGMVPVLDRLAATGQYVLWIAPDFEGEALRVLCTNFANKNLLSILVEAPSFGMQQQEILKDIACLTGATFVTKDLGMMHKDVTFEMFGTAKTVIVENRKTTIVEGGGSQEAVDARIEELRAQLPRTGSEYDREKIQDRIGKLLGGICTVKVGASSELELREVKGRMEDALYAARSALDGGVVPGGGTSMVRAASTVSFEGPEEQRPGWNLVMDACTQPFRTLVENGGHRSDMWLSMLEESEAPMGLDVLTMDWVDLLEQGVVDPVKVVVAALTNSVSIVGTMLTTEAAFHKKEEPTES